LDLEIRDANLLAARRDALSPNLADASQAMREALEHPIDYPPLRLGVTPDDHVAIVIDEGIPRLTELLVALLEHLQQAHIQPDAMTLVCPPPSTGQPWLDELPDAFQDVHIEVHQPGDRKKLAYLATTKHGRRVYLNRTVAEADQVVVLARRRYDPHTGYAGAETALFPWLAEQACIDEAAGYFDGEPPGDAPWALHAEAREVAWLAGAPFFVQVIEGGADAIAHIVAGPLESSKVGQQLLDARWRVVFDQPADVVIATITGDLARPTLDDFARAFHAAHRVAQPGGSIVLLAEAAPALGPAFEMFRRHDDPDLARSVLLKEKPLDMTAGWLWATAAPHARLYLLSGLASDVAEELYAIPLDHAGQTQRLLAESATCIVLPDAHRTLAVTADHA
jgi:nickel-dependent lactate racemase